MTQRRTADQSHEALVQEGGQPVSAGARVAHQQTHVSTGRGLFIDLTTVPEAIRPRVVSEIQEVIRRAAVTSPTTQPAG